MYNYRMGIFTDQDILADVYTFCLGQHNADEILEHVQKTLNKLFALHEYSFFNMPKNLDTGLWDRILSGYFSCMEKNNIKFPDRPVIGPKYHHSKKNYENFISDGNGITSIMPLFFGISYINKGNVVENMKQGKNPTPVLLQHRKLYDILYSLLRGEYRNDFSLGNLAKPSIFRFDYRAEGNYCKAFDFIRKELIYRLSDSNYTSWDKLRDAMFLEKHVSEVRSIVFFVVEELMDQRRYKLILKEESDAQRSKKEHCEEVYKHIINRCSKINVIDAKVSDNTKHTIPINMDIQGSEAVLYYGYIFFNHLSTTDYIHEIKTMFEGDNLSLMDAITLTDVYIRNRDLLIRTPGVWAITSDGSFDGSYILYTKIELFIDNNWDYVMKTACIDDFTGGKEKQFCKRHKEHMIAFIDLFNIIHHRKEMDKIHIKELLDILHLYIRLKRKKILIPTASSGYNHKKNVPTASHDNKKNISLKPVQVNAAMKLLKQEWELKTNNKPVPSELYMRNIIIETWISMVTYMYLRELNIDLLLKRFDATESLFYKIIQIIPSLIPIQDSSVDYNAIICDLLNIKAED